MPTDLGASSNYALKAYGRGSTWITNPGHHDAIDRFRVGIFPPWQRVIEANARIPMRARASVTRLLPCEASAQRHFHLRRMPCSA